MAKRTGQTILLATDQQRSTLNALAPFGPRALAYTPYGHRPVNKGAPTLFGFNGELPDVRTGHYHLGKGYRQLNPVLMRFNSPDSESPFDEGGLNAYAYCAGDPINRVDPTGHAFGFGRLLRIFTPNASSKIKNTAKSIAEAQQGISYKGVTYNLTSDANPLVLDKKSVSKIKQYRKEILKLDKKITVETGTKIFKNIEINDKFTNFAQKSYYYENLANPQTSRDIAVHNLNASIMNYNITAAYSQYVDDSITIFSNTPTTASSVRKIS